MNFKYYEFSNTLAIKSIFNIIAAFGPDPGRKRERIVSEI